MKLFRRVTSYSMNITDLRFLEDHDFQVNPGNIIYILVVRILNARCEYLGMQMQYATLTRCNNQEKLSYNYISGIFHYLEPRPVTVSTIVFKSD